MRKTIALSGGFDLLHIGHVRLINDASTYGDVIIILNSDEWLMRKKGFIFMPFTERQEILSAIRAVVAVVSVNDSDGTVRSALRELVPDYFGNGGDRTNEGIPPEHDVCVELGIKEVWNLGGGKVRSSSALATRFLNV